MFALGVQAASAASLAADEAELSAEKVALSVADDVLKKAGDKELADEIALKKAQDAVLKAMEKGDKDEVSKLQAKVRELTATEAADEKIKLAAAKEVTKDAALVKTTAAKVGKGEADEIAEENKELLQAEEGALKSEVGEGGQGGGRRDCRGEQGAAAGRGGRAQIGGRRGHLQLCVQVLQAVSAAAAPPPPPPARFAATPVVVGACVTLLSLLCFVIYCALGPLSRRERVWRQRSTVEVSVTRPEVATTTSWLECNMKA